MPRTALIVGAGIGGLSAAIALRRVGWHVQIHERAPSPRELGFGLVLAPNAISALRRLGVADAVLSRSFAPVTAEVRRMDGTVLKRAQLPSPDVLGGPLIVALRPALHGALLEALGIESIALGSEVTGFTAAAARATLHISDGRMVDGDLIVGADGIGSVIRRALHPSESPPRSSGIVAVRGAVDGAQAWLGDLSAVLYLGPGVEASIVRASETGVYWYVALARELVAGGMSDPAAIVRHIAPRFDATFRRVTGETTDLRVDDLVDRDPIPSWGGGVVTLLGDAAHPVLPHTGQGAAQAIVDAITLADAVAAESSVERALRNYEGARHDTMVRLLARGRRTARIMRTTNPVVVGARDLFIRLLPLRPLIKMTGMLNTRARFRLRN